MSNWCLLFVKFSVHIKWKKKKNRCLEEIHVNIIFTFYFLLIFVLYVATFHFYFVKESSVQFNFFLIQIFHFIWKKQVGRNVRKGKKRRLFLFFWLPMRRKKKQNYLKPKLYLIFWHHHHHTNVWIEND
jgi:dolichol kinase